MLAKTAFFTGQPAGFLDTLRHYKIGMADACRFNSVIHSLQFGLIFLLGASYLLKKDKQKKSKQKFPHA